MKMFTFSNFLSLLRAPLALLFLYDDVSFRVFAIIVAMLTDSLDGYYARRYRATSQIGAVLDPLMDKVFVLFALAVFVQEQSLTLLQAASFVCRDVSVILFGFYLCYRGYWSDYQFRSIWSGKMTTTLQFFVLLSLTFKQPVPTYLFYAFVLLGITALGELYVIHKDCRRLLERRDE